MTDHSYYFDDGEAEDFTILEFYASPPTELRSRGRNWVTVERNASFRALLHSFWYQIERECDDLAWLSKLFPLPAENPLPNERTPL